MNDNSKPSNEAIAFAHKRAFSRTSGKTTYAQHVTTCPACAAAKK